MMYDLVIGGAGLFGSTLAYYARMRGKRPLGIERDWIGGHCAGDSRHSYFGIHVFHTSNRWLWELVNSITHFKPVHYSPLAQYEEELYSFPINRLTLHQLGLKYIELREPRGKNFQSACLYSIGPSLYEKFFYHYTRKMWGVEPVELPVSILKRIPVRMDYNTSYYDDTYVGVPEEGFGVFFDRLLEGVDVVRGDFIQEHSKYSCTKVFTGSIDELHKYRHGELPYRGLEFAPCVHKPALAINYTDDRPYTREINYSYLWEGGLSIRETPTDMGRFYPVPWGVKMYNEYKGIETDVICAGRLGSYRYLNMNQVMEEAIELYWKIFE